MKTPLLFSTVCALGLGLAGCGAGTGFLIKPVPLDERLQETTIMSDTGPFITDKIAVVDVDGLLLNMKPPSLFGSGENPVSLFVEKMDKAQADPHVRAVVVRINSPGGAVTASDIMYHRLLRYRAACKAPVVAVIEDVGASGAYYLACGADHIIAHPTAVTGSIGVIVQTFSVAGTMSMLGITAKAITSGEYKDMGSPFKPLEPKDQQILQGIVNDFYKRFLGVVVAGRPKLSEEKIKQLADGRVFTGQGALANGLVDSLGYMNDAILLAKKESGASRVKVVMYHRPLGYKANAYSRASVPAAAQVNLLNVSAPELMSLARPEFLYLWTGQSYSKE